MEPMRRCGVCTTEVSPASIFCSDLCRDVAKVLRNAQPGNGEEFTLAEPLQVADDDPLVEQLTVAGRRHRSSVAVILAAFARAESDLDALVWAAHTRGLTDRQIGQALEMRTASVQRRVQAFQARLHGPVSRRRRTGQNGQALSGLTAAARVG